MKTFFGNMMSGFESIQTLKKIFRLFLFLGAALFWVPLTLTAQEEEQVITDEEVMAMDTNAQAPRIKIKKPWPDPKKAVLLSAALPGAGQVYNKRWWKLPIVYGAFGGLTYAIIFNTQQYDRLQTAYLLALDGEEHEFTGTSIDSPNALRTLRDQFDKNRQLSYIGIFFAYVLTGVDAFVDAHLRRFDINDDLSLRATPRFNFQGNITEMGIGITLTF
jgi:hypothetical protein